VTARALVEQIGALTETDRTTLINRLSTTDPFDRIHDRAYLDAVQRELERIALITAPALITPPPLTQTSARVGTIVSATPRAPEGLQAVRKRLILQITDAYHACFELAPAPGPASPFLPVIRIVAEEAGVDLPASDADLADLISAR
jgi:hypothetical protein